MTDKKLESLASEAYPHGVGIIRFLWNYFDVIANRKAFINGAKHIMQMYQVGVPLMEHKASDDMFDSDCVVTGCCGVGPITNENYCPNCGIKIEME